jgi:hypothetical protein
MRENHLKNKYLNNSARHLSPTHIFRLTCWISFISFHHTLFISGRSHAYTDSINISYNSDNEYYRGGSELNGVGNKSNVIIQLFIQRRKKTLSRKS